MLSKLRRWLREGAILLVLLAGVIILLDVWRSPQMPAMFDSTPLHTLDGEVSRWLSRKRVTFPVVNDSGGEISRNWEISVTPTLVVVSKGLVVTTTSGWTSYWGMKLRLWRAAMF
ncbi:hypothetical protein ACP80Y_21925 [Escherichia coli]